MKVFSNHQHAGESPKWGRILINLILEAAENTADTLHSLLTQHENSDHEFVGAATDKHSISLYLICIYFAFPHRTSFCFILIFSEVNSSSKLRARPRPAHWNFPRQGASLGSGSAQLTANEVPYAEGCNLSYSMTSSATRSTRTIEVSLQVCNGLHNILYYNFSAELQTTTVTWPLTSLDNLFSSFINAIFFKVKVGYNELISLLNTVISIQTFSEPKWKVKEARRNQNHEWFLS